MQIPPSSAPRSPAGEVELDDWDLEQSALKAVTSPPKLAVVLQPIEGENPWAGLEEDNPWARLEPEPMSPQRQALLLLKCLALVDLTVKNTRHAARQDGHQPSSQELLLVAMRRVSELPVDVSRHAEFLAKFIAKAIGARVDSQAIRRFQLDRKVARPNFLPEALSEDEKQARAAVRLMPIDGRTNFASPDFEEAVIASYPSWGRNAFDQGPGRISFDEEQAVIEDVRAIPALGQVLFTGEGRLRSRLLKRTTLAVVVGCFGCLGLALVAFLNREKPEPVLPASLLDARMFTSPDLDVVGTTLRGYLTTPDWAKQLAYVRAPGMVEDKMRAWYAKHPRQPLKDVRVRSAHVELLHGNPFLLVRADVTPRGRRDFLLEVINQREYKVDWEFAELYTETDWTDFIDARTEQPAEMRCLLKEGQYYNWSFSDRARLDCWALLDPRQKGMALHGYVEKDSPAGQQLRQLHNERLYRKVYPAFICILKLAYPPDSQDPSQVRIVDIVEPCAVRAYVTSKGS